MVIMPTRMVDGVMSQMIRESNGWTVRTYNHGQLRSEGWTAGRMSDARKMAHEFEAAVRASKEAAR